MSRYLLCALAITAWTGCRGDASKAPAEETASAAPAPAKTGIEADIENICFAEQRSGAFDIEESVRQVHVAQWLGSHIETQEARTFLAALAQAAAIDKSVLLRNKAKEHGLTNCPLADAWSGG